MSVPTAETILAQRAAPVEPPPSLLQRLLGWVGIRLGNMTRIQDPDPVLKRLESVFEGQRQGGVAPESETPSILPLLVKDYLSVVSDPTAKDRKLFSERAQNQVNGVLKLADRAIGIRDRSYSTRVLTTLDAIHAATRLYCSMNGVDVDRISKNRPQTSGLLSRVLTRFISGVNRIIEWLRANPSPELMSECHLIKKNLETMLETSQKKVMTGYGKKESPCEISVHVMGLEGSELTIGGPPDWGGRVPDIYQPISSSMPMYAVTICNSFSQVYAISSTLEEVVDTILVLTYFFDIVGRCVKTLMQQYQSVWLNFFSEGAHWPAKEIELNYISELENNPDLAEALKLNKGISPQAQEWLNADAFRKILITVTEDVKKVATELGKGWNPEGLQALIEKLKMTCCQFPTVSTSDISATLWDGLGGIQKDIEELTVTINQLNFLYVGGGEIVSSKAVMKVWSN